MMKDIGDLNKLIDQSDKEVSNIERQVPILNNSLTSGRRLHNQLDEFIKSNISYTLESIRYKIGNARSLVSRVQVGVFFNGGTSATLQSPIPDGESNTKISMDVRTTQQDGLLMYIGDPLSSARRRRQTANGMNYLMISLVKGKITVIAEAGGEMIKLESRTTVSDGKWYSVSLKR